MSTTIPSCGPFSRSSIWTDGRRTGRPAAPPVGRVSGSVGGDDGFLERRSQRPCPSPYRSPPRSSRTSGVPGAAIGCRHPLDRTPSTSLRDRVGSRCRRAGRVPPSSATAPRRRRRHRRAGRLPRRARGGRRRGRRRRAAVGQPSRPLAVEAARFVACSSPPSTGTGATPAGPPPAPLRGVRRRCGGSDHRPVRRSPVAGGGG